MPLFQEQLMEMAVAIAGFSAAEADELRQAMAAKRSAARMARLQGPPLRRHGHRGASPGRWRTPIYRALAAFANFGFPESHSVSFAHLVYSSAWLKLHYPAAFFAGLLNAQPMGFWSPQSLVADAKRHGVTVRRPHVERAAAPAPRSRGPAARPTARPCGWGWPRCAGSARRWPSGSPPGVPGRGQEDLVRRAGVTRAQLEALAAAGALDPAGPGARLGRTAPSRVERRRLLWAAGAAAQGTPDRLPGHRGGDRGPTPARAHAARHGGRRPVGARAWPRSGRPSSWPAPTLDGLGVVPAAGLGAQADGCRVLVAGVVTHRQHPETARGAVFVNLEDETGHVNVVFSRGAWARWRHGGPARPGAGGPGAPGARPGRGQRDRRAGGGPQARGARPRLA